MKQFLLLIFLAYIVTVSEATSSSSPNKSEQKSLNDIHGTVKGFVVWSSSRSHQNHDIWIMKADGTNSRALTNSPNNVDWFPRISPDGKRVLFVRSKSGWINEMDAELYDKWDIWTVDIDGSNEKKIVENGCWGTWLSNQDSLVFARGPKVIILSISTGNEKVVFDAESYFQKKKVYSQQPEISRDGKFIAITLRGTKRETGIFNREKNVWNTTGAGCELSWFPDSRQLVRMNEGQGNGGTEILKIDINDNGEPLVRLTGLTIPKEIRFMDLVGRRSHEYFPRIDQQTGSWMVWGATQYGQAHDTEDYEIYIWNINTDKKKGPVRLTFHSSNDRWPDIYIQ